MSVEQLSNVKFVKAVEAHPCLWDTRSKKYRKMEFVKDAWHKISLEFNESANSCRDRWSNIRSAFLLSLKRYPEESSSKKQYYLKPHLKFLVPFIKRNNRLKNCSDTEDTRATESEEETKPGDFLGEGLRNDSSDIRDIIKCESTTLQSPGHSASEPCTIHCDRHHKSNTEFNNDEENLRSKRRKWSDENEEEDPNMIFFKSLMGDVRKMNDRQNRKFRFRVMQIVGEILDDE